MIQTISEHYQKVYPFEKFYQIIANVPVCFRGPAPVDSDWWGAVASYGCKDGVVVRGVTLLTLRKVGESCAQSGK